MLELTRLNGHPILVNVELLKTAEAAPDTVLTLINGEKLIVLESPAEIRERAMRYRAEILHQANTFTE